MKIFKTAIYHETGPEIYLMDTIHHEGKLWLVPWWLEAPTEGWKKPERIIRLDAFPYQKGSSGFPYDFLLNSQLHRDICFGQIPNKLIEKDIVRMCPDIKVSIPKGIH